MQKRELTTKQRAAIVALVAGANHTEAAKAAGVKANQIPIWLKQDNFALALRAAESAALSEVTRGLLGLASKARATLEELLDSSQPGSVRVRACDLVISKLLQLRENITLEERIAELERQAEEVAKGSDVDMSTLTDSEATGGKV